jgi:uncharacterized protein (TIGR00251 family)
MGKITERDNSLFIEIFIKPNKKESKLVFEDDAFILQITASPVKGKANKEIIQFLSTQFHISKNQIFIIAGSKSKTKTIKFCDLNEINILHFLNK